jgi:SecD/SecF fusion protein
MADRRFKPKKRPSKIRNHVVLLILLAVMIIGSVVLFTPPQTRIKQGLDVQGGLSVVLQGSKLDGSAITIEEMGTAQTVVENRVNPSGATEASVQIQGDSQLLVQIPGVIDQTETLETIGKTGYLEFVNVADITDESIKSMIDADQITYTVPVDAFNEDGTPKEDYDYAPYQANLADGDDSNNPQTMSVPITLQTGTYTSIFTGADITNVKVDKASETSADYAVNIELNSTAAQAFGDVTTQLYPTKGKIAIVLDGVIQNAPAVQNAITTGQVQITGGYDLAGANQLKTILDSGSLPVTLTVVNSQVVGPTLGQASLVSGVVVALIGLALVALYLLVFYRGLGLLTAGAVIIFAVLYLGVLAALSLLNLFSLSLAGIAGIVLSIGVAADSSILVLERFKEEIRMGRSVKASSITGVKHAIITSIDADFVTLVSALALFFIAVGAVKGFGLTLALGVVCDILTMVLFKAPLIRLLAPKVIAKNPGFWGVKEDEDIALASGELKRGESRG